MNIDNPKLENRNQEANNTISKVIRGYTGLIPTKFRELSEKEINNYIQEDVSCWVNKIEKSILLDANEVTKTIKIIVAQNKYDLFIKMPNILSASVKISSQIPSGLR